MHDWSIRDAKDHLSQLIEAAQSEPQAITRRGRCAAILISEREFKRLQRQAEPLTGFFARAGLEDIDIERVEAGARDEGEL
ncbi:MAG TPA: type II toxin-antitoxin system Phd/YefM family antitoxin [Stellaceae bacterium]|jgi:prevent-host-death family protein